MNGLVIPKRIVALLLLAMAAALLVSVAGAPNADAKKKKEPNVVQCVVNQLDCRGTDGRDHLVGTGSDDFMIGAGGGDILEANGGDDTMQGGSGSDLYTGNEGDFGSDFIKESGGKSDLLDLSSFSSEDFAFSLDEDPTDLILDGPGSNEIELDGQFSGSGKLEKIKFADKTLKGKQIKNLVGEATAKVQATPDERSPEDERPTQEKEK